MFSFELFDCFVVRIDVSCKIMARMRICLAFVFQLIMLYFGCLQNYTGDRLNFGLAAEQAKSEGYKVEVFVFLLRIYS